LGFPEPGYAWRRARQRPERKQIDDEARQEADAPLHTAKYVRAEQVLAEALACRPDGPLHPELLYRLAITE
jgi:hypothetical protein